MITKTGLEPIILRPKRSVLPIKLFGSWDGWSRTTQQQVIKLLLPPVKTAPIKRLLVHRRRSRNPRAIFISAPP